MSTITIDPEGEYVKSQLEKIDRIYAEMEHHLMLGGKPQNNAPSYFNMDVSQFPRTTAPVTDPAKREEHLKMVSELKVGTATAMAKVGTGEFFKTRKQRWILRGLVAGASLMFIIFAFAIGHLIWRLVRFH